MGLSKYNVITNEARQELVEHGSALFPIACYCAPVHTIPVPWHWHEELEAVVIAEGTAVLAVGTEKYVLERGCGFLINSGVLHAVWPMDSSAGVLHSMCFHPKLIGGSRDSIFWSKYLRPLLDDKTASCFCLRPDQEWEQKAIHGIESAWSFLVEEPDGYEFEVRYALSQLLLLLTNHHSLAASCRSLKSIRSEERLKNMLRYIQQNFHMEIKLQDIADHAAISTSECLRCFRSTIGTTPIQYVKQYRLQRAADLLRNTNLYIEEVAERCGFYDMSYFSKEFRKTYHCTPSEYKKVSISAAKEQGSDSGSAAFLENRAFRAGETK